MNGELLDIACGKKKADTVLKNGRLIDIFNLKLFEADLAIASGMIVGTGDYSGLTEIDLNGQIVSPGFIDGHLHLESAMVEVEEFARLVIPLGTTTIVADPHEIANVSGVAGIEYLLKSGRRLPWNFNLMLPSCVPATRFETSGAQLGLKDLKPLLKEDGIFGLGEVMDYPAVISGDRDIQDKIEMVGDRFIDGHAPGVKGKDLNSYLLAGIQADHEATTSEEALEKVRKGMYIMIREGSVTRDLISLLPAVNDININSFLFATDDRHPGDLLEEGHINFLIKKAIKYGLSPLRAIKLATLNAARALGFNKLGAIAPGYRADLVVIDDLDAFNIKMVYKDGKLVAEGGRALFNIPVPGNEKSEEIFNSIRVSDIDEDKFRLPVGRKYRVMELVKDQVVTKHRVLSLSDKSNNELIKNDLVKLAVVERHQYTGNVGLGLLKGYGLQDGAIATSIGHDSHNIIVAGLNSQDMKIAVEELVKINGGIVIVKDGQILECLALPVAGLLSQLPIGEVADKLKELRKIAADSGVKVKGPFMTLSFMALPVIPELKITDKGLFDVVEFRQVSLVQD